MIPNSHGSLETLRCNVVDFYIRSVTWHSSLVQDNLVQTTRDPANAHDIICVLHRVGPICVYCLLCFLLILKMPAHI
jgi:hypothetical protein